ncbi:MAG TPA: hypothetical protein PLE01_07390 [Syntrophothermus lipocalidus]|nr:hypothetical protein [Syntrophothermus lipocalidus]
MIKAIGVQEFELSGVICEVSSYPVIGYDNVAAWTRKLKYGGHPKSDEGKLMIRD